MHIQDLLRCDSMHAVRKRSGCSAEAARQRKRRRQKSNTEKNVKATCGAVAEFF